MRLCSTLAPAAGGATRRAAAAIARRRGAVRDMGLLPGAGAGASAGERELLADSLEEALVDLAVVDRDSLLVAEPDDVFALHSVLLRQLIRRQVIRHCLPPCSSPGNEKPTDRDP